MEGRNGSVEISPEKGQFSGLAKWDGFPLLLGAMLEDLKEEVWRANLLLVSEGLVRLTWGNVSGLDHDAGLFAIKPSGVAYEDLRPEQMVLVDLEGQVAEGALRPSSDTPTHRLLYRGFDGIGGITHTHSPHATAFSQAGKALPCLGTTHADHFHGTVPVVRELSPEEVAEDYEGNTGRAIVEHFEGKDIDPVAMPACFQRYHAPFAWGADAVQSVKNAVALEVCCGMALETWQLGICSGTDELPEHILEKHFSRKHGPDAYYGQG